MIFKTKKGKYQLSFLIFVRAQGLAPPPRRSFANAHRRTKVRLSLVVVPFFQGSFPYCALKTKKLPIGSFFVLIGTRAGIGSAATALIRKCSPAYFRPPFACGAPFFQGSFPYCDLKTKKLPIGSFFVLMVRAQGLAPPPRRSFANARRRTPSAFRLWSHPFSSVLSLTAL